MYEINWTLFNVKLSESLDSNTSEINHQKNNDNPNDEIDSQSFSISDIIRDVFYVTTLKEIKNNDIHSNDTDTFINRLNRFDKILLFFMKKSKEITTGLIHSYNTLNNQTDLNMEDQIINYTNILFNILKQPQTYSPEDLTTIEVLLVLSVSPSNNRLLSEHFKKIHIQLDIYIGLNNSQDLTTELRIKRRQQKQRIYRLIRKLPLYLGGAYTDRYNIYQKIILYPKRNNKKSFNHKPIVNIIMNTKSFDDYFDTNLKDIISNLENLQKNICNLDIIVNPNLFENAILDLYKAINSFPGPVKKKYLTGKSCFALMDIYCNNIAIELITFSGTFDSRCSYILSKFGQFPTLINAINDIATSSRFANSILVTTSCNIKYYFTTNKFVTLGSVVHSLSSGFKCITRMFSCCERKLLTYAEHIANAQSYKLFTKYDPCELCIIILVMSAQVLLYMVKKKLIIK